MPSTARIGIARLLQTFCFLTTLASAQDTARKLLFWTWSSQPLSPGVARALREEVGGLRVPGFGGVEVQEGGNALARARDLLVTVEIQGGCSVNHVPFVAPRGPLGYVVQTEGHIEPMMFVNCAAILSAIRPFLLEQPKRFQDVLVARAMVRVMRHELRHILEQTVDHLANGIFKAHLQPLDLISQPGY